MFHREPARFIRMIGHSDAGELGRICWRDSYLEEVTITYDAVTLRVLQSDGSSHRFVPRVTWLRPRRIRAPRTRCALNQFVVGMELTGPRLGA